jgi:hypothetical protein
MTSRSQARRLPLAPLVPQKTVSALPCPIVERSHMPWLPDEGSRFPMAHSRGVARLHNPVGGHLSWGEVGTNQTAWFSTIFPPRLQPHPNRWLDLSQKLCGQQRAAGLAECHSTPAPVYGPPPSERPSDGSSPGSVGKTAGLGG